jgi:catechol 2,3-dioxygenase-like lactoylglutathione lyase family enzyme
MNMKSLVAVARVSAALFSLPLAAQLAGPNSAGVAIGHVHINAKDVDAQQKFLALVGGVPVNNEKLVMMQFPGIYVVLRKQDSTGGTVGSVLNHFGFHVKNLDEWLPKWKAAGIPIEPGNNPKQMFLTGPDDVRVEIIEDAKIPTPVEMHHIHLFVPDPLAAQAWYVKNFGAAAGKRLAFETATVPGAEITFTKTDMPQAGTKNRGVDHMGFEVKNIDAVVKKLDEAGIRVDAPIRTSANASKLRIAYVNDPWGTYIELTEGLAPSH